MDYRIKEVCKEKGLLFKDLAAKVGVTDIALRASLRKNPTMSTLEKIAAALGVSVVDLLDVPASGSITCPHCGKSINIKIDVEQSKQ